MTSPSVPPLLPEHAQQFAGSFAPTANSVSSLSFAPPDYGPFGTAPGAQDVTYFREKWSERQGAVLTMILGSVLVPAGLLVLLGRARGFGIGLTLVGVLLIYAGLKSRKRDVHVDVLCDGNGITVRRNNGKQGNLPSTWVPWQAVSSTRCSVSEYTSGSAGDAGGPTTSYAQNFAIDMLGSEAVVLSTRSFRHLDEFVAIVNQQTQHLGYRWLTRKLARGLPTLEESYRYVKVPLA